MSAPTILVIGGTAAALEAAREVIAQGGRAELVQGGPRKACALRTPSGIEAIPGAMLFRLEGSPGRFIAHLSAEGERFTVEADAVILTDGTDDAAEEIIGLADAPEAVRSTAFVLGPHASRRDHMGVIRGAAELRSRPSPPEVTIFSKEILASGADELTYAQAQRAGVRFVRCEAPSIERGPPATVRAVDSPTGLEVEVRPDRLVIEGLEPGPMPSMGEAAGNVSMGPTSTLREGVLVCRARERGLCGSDALAEARAAATRAMTLALRPPDRTQASARVDRDRCSACLTCVRSCPFRAPRIDEEGKAAIDASLCQACGVCVAACPGRALSLPDDGKWKKELGSLFEVGR